MSATAQIIDGNEPKEEKKAIPELSIDSRVLIDRLEATEEGDVIPYSELNALVGRNVQTNAKGNLETARRYLLRERGFLFGIIRSVGVKHLDNKGVESNADMRIKQQGRASRRMQKEIRRGYDFQNATAADKLKMFARLSFANVMEMMTKRRSISKMEKVIGSQKPAELPPAETLRMFQED